MHRLGDPVVVGTAMMDLDIRSAFGVRRSALLNTNIVRSLKRSCLFDFSSPQPCASVDRRPNVERRTPNAERSPCTST
jgi:hypothetical protein